jgi:hypothetical protein
MKRLLFVLPVLAGLFFAGCDTSTDYSPLTVGNVWNYSGYGTVTSTLSSTDTTWTLSSRIEITRADTLNSGLSVLEMVMRVDIEVSSPETTWTTIDTVYLHESDTLVMAYANKADTVGTVDLRLPFEAGKTWTVGAVVYTVTEQEDVTVPVKTYKGAWRIDATNSSDPDFSAKMWHASGVGMVKREETSVSGSETMHMVMELTSATIK